MSKMVKLDANMEAILPKRNMPSTSNITILRFLPENNNGIVGPKDEETCNNSHADTICSLC